MTAPANTHAHSPTPGDLPQGLPPLPADSTYRGQLKEHSGEVYGFVFEVGSDVQWVGPLHWDGVADRPHDPNALWHFAEVATAPAEPAPLSRSLGLHYYDAAKGRLVKVADPAAQPTPGETPNSRIPRYSLHAAIEEGRYTEKPDDAGRYCLAANVDALERRAADAEKDVVELRKALGRAASILKNSDIYTDEEIGREAAIFYRMAHLDYLTRPPGSAVTDKDRLDAISGENVPTEARP